MIPVASEVFSDRLRDGVMADGIGEGGGILSMPVPVAAAAELAADVRRRVAGLRDGHAIPDAGRLRVADVRWDGTVDRHALGRSPGYEARVAEAMSAMLPGIDGTAEIVESLAIEDAATKAFLSLFEGTPAMAGRELGRGVMLCDPEGDEGDPGVLANATIEPVGGDGETDAGDTAREPVVALATCHVWSGCDGIARNGRPGWAVGLADRIRRLARATKDAYPDDPSCVVAVVVADEGTAGIVAEGWAWLAAETEDAVSDARRWGERRSADSAELILVGLRDAG